MAYFEGSIGTPSGGFNLKVEYSISQSVSGNYSDVTATGYVKRNSSSYWPYNSSSSASLSINGTAKSYTGSYDLRSDGYKTITSNTVRVYHNNDGTKSITISFSFNGKLSSYYPNGSISQTITLPTIPRASTVACSSPYIGDTATITISKKVSSFTHNVTYHIGELTGTIAESTSETVLSLDTSAIKEEIYALIPNSKEIAATIRCRTYNGDTKIGDTQVANFNLYAKESECKPDVSGTVVDTNEATSKYGKLVKYISKPKVTVEATPKYNSTIKSYSINLNDGQSSTLQEDTFESIGSNSITVNATDSRGYSNPQTIELEMIDYVKLHIDNISIERTEDVSSEVLLNANGVWFNGSFNEENTNTLSASFQYNAGSGWVDGGTLTPTIKDNTFTFTDVSLGNIYDYNSEYQFKIIVSDSLMTTGNENKEAITVPKGQEVVAIGEDTVWVYGDLLLNDNPIIESGSNDNGSWIKYADGTMICCGKTTISTSRNSSWGSLYVSPKISGQAYPISFNEIKSVNLTLEADDNTVWVGSANKGTISNLPSFYIVSATGTSYENEYILNYTAIGSWK